MFALGEPGGTAPCECRRCAGPFGDRIAPPCQLWFDCKCCGFEVVGSVDGWAAEVVPCSVRGWSANRKRGNDQRHSLVDVREWFDHFADAGHSRSAPNEAEADVGSEICGLCERRSVDGVTGPTERSGSVGGAATEPTAFATTVAAVAATATVATTEPTTEPTTSCGCGRSNDGAYGLLRS